MAIQLSKTRKRVIYKPKRPRRTTYDIYAAVLVVAKRGLLVSHVGGRSGLNFKNAKIHVQTLVDAELIDEEKLFGYSHKYITSDKGDKYLKLYNEIVKLLSNNN